MKKKLLACVIVTILFTGCGANHLYDRYMIIEQHKEENKTYKEPVEIDYEEYTEKLKNKESFILLLYQTGCSHCKTYEPTVKEIISYYNLKIYALNLAELSDKEYSSIKNKTFVSGTPTTVAFEEGSYSDKIVGDKEKEEVLKFLVEAGYLEEK